MVNVLELLTRREGKTLEFKRDLSSSQNVLKTLVAFANTAGGVLLVGVDDGTRSIRGVADPILQEERLSNLVSDSIEPRLVPQIEGVFCENREIIAVEVHPSASRPHYLRSLGVERGVFVRVGSTNRQADQLLVAELRRSARSASFDEEPLSAFNSEAVDFRVASEFFRPVRELKPRDLEVLRLVVREQGRLVPSVGGMLLFGRNREEAFPDAWIQCGRFAGTDRQRIHDTVEVRDHLPAAAEQAISFVRKHAVRSADIGAVRRRDRWSIPLVAAREAVINAVVHADYSQRGAPIRVSVFDDRLEVENPGMLTPGLTIEDILGGVSKLRNRVIGRVFRELELIEQWGSGIQRMVGACRDAGLPDPAFAEVGTHFRVTIHTKPGPAPRADSTDEAICQAVTAAAAKGGISTSELAAAIGLSSRAIRTRLRSLLDRGLVAVVGRDSRDPKRKYFPAH